MAESELLRLLPATSVTARTAGLLRGEGPALTPKEEKRAAELAFAEGAAPQRASN